MSTNKTQEHHRKALLRIPGGTHLLSKRPEMFLPGRWPGYYSRGKGVEVWDLDGQHFIDMTSTAIGACPLGFADPDVDRAAKAAIDAGSMTTLNCPEELELADLLVELHPWAEMVRYARTGGEAMAVAVRIARCATGRDKVAFCGYHGWHDWYLAGNLGDDSALDGHLLPGLKPAGVPRGLASTSFAFGHNRFDQFDTIVEEHSSELAAVVLEPVRYSDPVNGFLEHIRDAAERVGAVVVYDEISAGWRMNVGGSHLRYGVNPDIAVFAKALSNGYPMAAIIGRRPIMEAAQLTFISSTYWTERIGPAAAIATIRKYQECDVPAHLIDIGALMQRGWKALSELYDLPIQVFGHPPLTGFSFLDSEYAHTLSNLFTQEMLEREILATTSFYATYAHQSEHVEAYMAAADEAFGHMKEAYETGYIEASLKGPPSHTGFRRLT